MPGLFRTPPIMVFTDEDNRELGTVTDPAAVPRAGENVRLRGTPYQVERVGYDVSDKEVTRIFVVCRPV